MQCFNPSPPVNVDASIEAPPSVLPQRRYCDITGLEVNISLALAICVAANPCCVQGPYTDPATGLRYHDKSIYELIKGLVGLNPWVSLAERVLILFQSAPAAKEYLAARGVNPIVK